MIEGVLGAAVAWTLALELAMRLLLALGLLERGELALGQHQALLGDLDLAKGGLLKRQSKDQRLNLGRRAVGQKRLAPRQLLKRQLASGLVEILEAIEAVARVAHHLAGLTHVAELPGELQQANFGPDDLLFLCHDQCPLERRGRALRTPTTPRPASAHASA